MHCREFYVNGRLVTYANEGDLSRKLKSDLELALRHRHQRWVSAEQREKKRLSCRSRREL